MKWRKETCYVGYDRRGFACAVVLREHVRWLLIMEREFSETYPTLRDAEASADQLKGDQ